MQGSVAHHYMRVLHELSFKSEASHQYSITEAKRGVRCSMFKSGGE